MVMDSINSTPKESTSQALEPNARHTFHVFPEQVATTRGVRLVQWFQLNNKERWRRQNERGSCVISHYNPPRLFSFPTHSITLPKSQSSSSTASDLILQRMIKAGVKTYTTSTIESVHTADVGREQGSIWVYIASARYNNITNNNCTRTILSSTYCLCPRRLDIYWRK